MLNFRDLGLSPYQQTWDLQKKLQSRRIKNEIEDTVLLVEHEPVYTFGKNADDNHLLQNYPDDVNIFHIERGGDITFHGPGQLVGYPIIDLHNYKMSISWFMRSLEDIIINTLMHYDIAANRKEGLTGVWVKDEKIAALGVRISRWVTMHGFALNVNTQLHYYDSIIPCGIFEYGVTSMEKVLSKEIDMDEVKHVLIQQFENIFNSHLTSVD
ncbi:MAG: lipoyl(octanoyl) transferase LipB [Candidatus Marinimicrobia bacterium]|jgi:lipoyl(octanoyl) transferase|nr:lipoyl(octanoyl) transferase LipB [Candidatus Neomarinimicrobiota bacterium]MDP6726802.1 lipoyl(octanoyl) transferase LipB [Candidatus Neomarinimicrobiota bacterium]|tara:strand:- start:7450 stop:8085 length:636 start_codon:yes stop_codon:yes gene_type:complete